MEKKKNEMNLVGIEDMLTNFDSPDIESCEKKVMKAISSTNIKRGWSGWIVTPFIGYSISSFLILLFYSRNVALRFIWDYIGDTAVSFFKALDRITFILSAFLPSIKSEYAAIPLASILLIVMFAAVSKTKKNNKEDIYEKRV